MKCPKCGTELQPTNRHGVNVGHCPACQGQWFDQGELDRLLRRVSVLERRHRRCSDREGYLGL